MLERLLRTFNYREEAEFDPPDNAKELEEVGDGASFQSVFDHIKITKPEKLKGMTVGDYLKSSNWSDAKLAKEVEMFWKNRNHYAYCTGDGRKRHPLKVPLLLYNPPFFVYSKIFLLSFSNRIMLFPTQISKPHWRKNPPRLVKGNIFSAKTASHTSESTLV
jgi:hypothetical protein